MNIAEAFYSPAACLVKVSILLQILHIFVVNKRRLYWTIIGLIVVTIAFYISVCVARILACVPREKIWNTEVPGTCVNSYALVLSSATINVILDFTMLLIPVVKIWKLQMSVLRKIGISLVFGTGLL